jgi:hypothetical protein
MMTIIIIIIIIIMDDMLLSCPNAGWIACLYTYLHPIFTKLGMNVMPFFVSYYRMEIMVLTQDSRITWLHYISLEKVNIYESFDNLNFSISFCIFLLSFTCFCD